MLQYLYSKKILHAPNYTFTVAYNYLYLLLQDCSIKNSCYLCIGLWENSCRTYPQRGVFNLDEGILILYPLNSDEISNNFREV